MKPLLLFAKSCLMRVLIGQAKAFSVQGSVLQTAEGLDDSFGCRGAVARRRSSLPGLHVGRYRSPGRQALEALVGVVDEDPVLVLQVGLGVVGHLGGCGTGGRRLLRFFSIVHTISFKL